MNILYTIFFSFLGGPGERYVESRGTKDIITLETYNFALWYP